MNVVITYPGVYHATASPLQAHALNERTQREQAVIL
jgi:hypothetical protein